MENLLQKVLKLGEAPLAHKKCESCIFKVVDYEQEPCFSCKHGKYAGEKSNYVKEGE
jgi:hypothetical protein